MRNRRRLQELLRVRTAGESAICQSSWRYWTLAVLAVATPSLVGQQGQTPTSSAPTSLGIPACDPGTSGQTLTGTVTDGTGAAIPNARVVLRCGDVTRTLQTGRDGRWSTVLPASRYAVRVTGQGFSDVLPALSPEDLSRSVDVALHVASANQSVEVLGTPDYVASTDSSGTKTSTALIDTPQAITTVTRAELDARDTQTIQDTLRYSAGIVAEPFGIDTREDSFIIRGFSLTFDGLFLDGLALPKVTIGPDAAYTNNPFSLQEVDIIKGPASVLYGQDDRAAWSILSRSTRPRKHKVPYDSRVATLAVIRDSPTYPVLCSARVSCSTGSTDLCATRGRRFSTRATTRTTSRPPYCGSRARARHCWC